jgi:O-antigen ligase
VLLVIVASRLHYFEVLIRSRLHTSGRSESAHFGVYDFVPAVLHSHPLFGLGLNTFSVYYQFVTGKSNWGPHSFYVALIVETGLVGTIAFLLFLRYLFARLHAARAIGRALAAFGEPAAARVRPLAWGMTAALAATMAANVFYLTMQFYYFYAFAVLVLALPLVFSRSNSIISTSNRTFRAASSAMGSV